MSIKDSLLEILRETHGESETSDFSEYPIISESSPLYSLFDEAVDDVALNYKVGTLYKKLNENGTAMELWEICIPPHTDIVEQVSNRIRFLVKRSYMENGY